MDIDRSRFPSGRSVGNCRNDAKRLAKAERIPLHLAQDRIAATNGAGLPWDKAISAISAGGLGFAPAATTLHSLRRPITVADIRMVHEKYPHLTHFGMGISRVPPGSDFATELSRGKQELLEALGEIELCCQFLAHVEKRKTVDTRGFSSYGLKHQVEVFQRARIHRPDNAYVSNGALICAAVIMGFDVLQPPRGGPNVWFNMSRRSPAFEWRRRHDAHLYCTRAQLAAQDTLALRLGVHALRGSYDGSRSRSAGALG